MSEKTLYEFYTLPGIQKGLLANGNEFTLNDKPITIYSGALHYFRVHPDYWRDRLKKLRACGLNCVETYVPWNIHEPFKGIYDFGEANFDFSIFANIKVFLKLAKEEDLFVILRPGPYICAEWEFGGLPSYLLRNKNIQVRKSDPIFCERVELYFERLLKEVTPFQFIEGGPIISFQIENEYGNVKEENEMIDINYLLFLKKVLEDNGVRELLFTSDTPSLGFSGTIPNVLATANFQENPEKELNLLREFQPHKPLMIMEYWTGWFDHWTEEHQLRSVEKFTTVLETILKMGASVNFYMFHGGTNWGFLNGANCFDNDYQADTTSYDYDAPLSEAGDYTEKYFVVKELIEKYSKIQFKKPDMPLISEKYIYPRIKTTVMLSLDDLVRQLNFSTKSEHLIPMELIPKQNTGQCFGYILYRKKNLTISPKSVLKLTGNIRDQALVLINGVLKSKPLTSVDDFNDFGYWKSTTNTLNLDNVEEIRGATLDILVSNWGRVNFGKLKYFKQFKGLHEAEVQINGNVILDWYIYPLEFHTNWNRNLSKWNSVEYKLTPTLYRAELIVNEPKDTFIDMRKWCQGIVVVNDFVLSRYCSLGPQQTSYIPAPFLKKGINNILIFEQYLPAEYIEFTNYPIFENKVNNKYTHDDQDI